MSFHLVISFLFVLCGLPTFEGNDAVDITITNTKIGTEIPTNFAGFSMEVPDAPIMMGKHPNPPRKSLYNLFEQLRAKSNESFPTIRIGGNSADESWWNPDGKPNPPNDHYSITEADFESYTAFSDYTKQMTDGKYWQQFIGDTNMNLEYNNTLTVDYMLALEKYLQDHSMNWDHYFLAFEIGNEPDIFSGHGLRPKDYNLDDYIKDTGIYLAGVQKAVKTLPKKFMEAATWCCSEKWQSPPSISKFVSTSDYKDASVNFCMHKYPTAHCNNHVVTIDNLLSDEACEKWRPIMDGWSKATGGLPLVLGESNSAACGGMPGVSDVFAAALWSIDWMFNIAAGNVKRINFHGGPGGYYAPIKYNNPSDNNDPPEVMPEFYGMLAFTEATSGHSTIIQLNATTSNKMIKSWGVVSKDDRFRVVIIHKDYKATQPADVTIHNPLPSGMKTGNIYLARLSAPSITSGKGLTWAKQTFDGTKEGFPSGHYTLETVKYDEGSEAWKFQVTPASAVLAYLPVH